VLRREHREAEVGLLYEAARAVAMKDHDERRRLRWIVVGRFLETIRRATTSGPGV